MKEEHRAHLREVWKDPERREFIGKVVSKKWREDHDEMTRVHRDTDNRKYIELKEIKQTEFGTGVREPEGYRNYMREVQRIYRENNPAVMEYYREYGRQKNARKKAEKTRKLQESLMTPSQAIGRYVVTKDGRFFNISNGREYFPDRYVIIEGKRYRKDKLIYELFFSQPVGEPDFFELTEEQFRVLEQLDRMGLGYEIN